MTSAVETVSDDLSLSLKTPWRVWLVVILLTLLFHGLVLIIQPHLAGPMRPPQVEVQQVDPNKLEAIRKLWKQREKELLIDKYKNAPKDQEAPKNARFQSDRNIRVEKEQRARNADVLPKPGAKAEPKQQKKEAGNRAKPVPNLAQLGVPFQVSKKKPVDQNRQRSARTADPGADQAIEDKDIPVGSENILNAQESVYYSFYSRLYEAIAPIWQSKIREVAYQRTVQPGEYSTSIDLVLDEQGNLIGIRHIKDSGIREFDAAVDESWKRIGKFPNPPRDLIGADGYVHTGWTFTVEVNETTGFQYYPPERNY
jgi:hypothetical protein